MSNLNPIANAESNGFGRITQLEFPMDENDDLRVFYLEFNTSPLNEPGMFGAFWHMPIFTSHVELNSSNELQWYAPNGVTYYFCAHLAEKKGKKIESFVDNSSTWRALVAKNGFVIKSLIDESSFTYRDGRLSEFMLNDKRGYTISYSSSNGRPLAVKERSGKSVLSFEYEKDQRHVKSVKTYKGIYKFGYHGRKSGDILGTDNFYGNALLMAKIEHPDASPINEFEYSKSLSRPRGILLKDLTEISTQPLSVKKMTIKAGGKEKGWIEWCSATGLIMADSGGQYMIGNDKFDSFFPNFKPGQGNAKFSAIKYKKPEMPHPQIYFFDFDNFYEITGDPDTGEILRKSKIGACGPLKLKTRKVEMLSGPLKDDVWSLVKTNSFDDKGRLVRTIDADGNVREYFYDKKFGGLALLMENGVLKHSNKFSDSGKLIEEITVLDGVEIKRTISPSGDFEEEFKDGKIKRRLEYANGEIVKTILYDDNGERKAFDSIQDLLNFN